MTSSPASRVFDHCFNGPLNAIRLGSMVQSSSNTTVSTPSGKMAPVRIRQACPSSTRPLNGTPAAARPLHKFIIWGPSAMGPAKP